MPDARKALERDLIWCLVFRSPVGHTSVRKAELFQDLCNFCSLMKAKSRNVSCAWKLMCLEALESEDPFGYDSLANRSVLGTDELPRMRKALVHV